MSEGYRTIQADKAIARLHTQIQSGVFDGDSALEAEKGKKQKLYSRTQWLQTGEES